MRPFHSGETGVGQGEPEKKIFGQFVSSEELEADSWCDSSDACCSMAKYEFMKECKRARK